jgi:succinyl-diaminopimelate desuccinylase
VARSGALQAALARIDSDELVELTRELVRIPSVVRPGEPGGNESAVARRVEEFLRKEGFALEVHEVAPGRPNVVAWLGEKGSGKSLLLEGHTDVVTEGAAAEWSHPPFGAELVDGRIYGRGAADMKSGLAAAMLAAAAIKRSGVAFRGKLVVGALVDEEGDMLGAKHLCATPTGRELDAAIICEPEQNELCLEQRGVVWARVLIRGRMAHGAMPEAGVNPIGALGALLAEVPRLERRALPAEPAPPPAHGDPHGRAGARRRRPAVERDPVGRPRGARRQAHAGARREGGGRGDRRRVRGRDAAAARRDDRVAAGQRLSARDPGRAR